jgi:hypothetical protein
MTRTWIETAGVLMRLDCALPWVCRLIGAGRGLRAPDAAGDAAPIGVEAERRPFDTAGWEPLTRGAWRRGAEVVVQNVATSGFDLHLRADGPPSFRFRWRPPPRDHVASFVARARFRLLVRAALVHYPALWLAGLSGRAPLHAAVCTAGGATPLLAGPGGVGKSTLLALELDAGGLFASDNLCVSDGHTAWGLAEPMRVESESGPRTTHGRVEVTPAGRVAALTPDRLVVVRRGLEGSPRLRPCSAAGAARSLVTGTYMAGELRRYWPLAASLAAATGLGPSAPPIEAVAERLASRLPCLELTLPSRPGARLAAILDPPESIPTPPPAAGLAASPAGGEGSVA